MAQCRGEVEKGERVVTVQRSERGGRGCDGGEKGGGGAV